MRITDFPRAEAATALVSFASDGTLWVAWRGNQTTSSWRETPPTVPDLAQFALINIYPEAGLREQVRMTNHQQSRSIWGPGRWQEFHRITFTPEAVR